MATHIRLTGGEQRSR